MVPPAPCQPRSGPGGSPVVNSEPSTGPEPPTTDFDPDLGHRNPFSVPADPNLAESEAEVLQLRAEMEEELWKRSCAEDREEVQVRKRARIAHDLLEAKDRRNHYRMKIAFEKIAQSMLHQVNQVVTGLSGKIDLHMACQQHIQSRILQRLEHIDNNNINDTVVDLLALVDLRAWDAILAAEYPGIQHAIILGLVAQARVDIAARDGLPVPLPVPLQVKVAADEAEDVRDVDIAARYVAAEEGSSIGVFWPMDIFNQHSATKDLGLTPRFRRKIVEMAGVQGVVLPAEFTTDIPDECTPLRRCCEKTCSCQPSISPARD